MARVAVASSTAAAVRLTSRRVACVLATVRSISARRSVHTCVAHAPVARAASTPSASHHRSVMRRGQRRASERSGCASSVSMPMASPSAAVTVHDAGPPGVLASNHAPRRIASSDVAVFAPVSLRSRVDSEQSARVVAQERPPVPVRERRCELVEVRDVLGRVVGVGEVGRPHEPVTEALDECRDRPLVGIARDPAAVPEVVTRLVARAARGGPSAVWPKTASMRSSQ